MENYEELNIDQEFWADFIVEAFEHINDIESNVLTLEQNPDDMEIIHTMFRAFHTIKGLSGFVEHTVIQEIAHKTETLMDYCRKGELAVNTKIVDAILKSSDYVKRLCEDVDSYKDKAFLAQIEALLNVLVELADVQSTPAETAEEPAEIEAEIEVEVEVETPTVEISDAQRDLDAFVSNFLESKAEEDKKAEKIIEPVEAEPIIAEIAVAEPIVEEVVEIAAVVEIASEPIVEIVAEPVAEPVVLEIDEVEPVVAAVKVEPVVAKAQEPMKSSTQTLEKPKIAPPVAEAAVKKLFSSSEDYMKVANGKIDHLVDMIGELIINQSLIDQYIESNYAQDSQLLANMSGFLRITRELQSLSMSLRMVSFKSTFQKVNRIARDTIQELGKDVEFVTSGDNTEIDRAVTDKLLDPLVHLIKNAISHGVETDVQARINKGKNKKARVELNAYNKRGKIFIEIKDDGRGIDTGVVYKKALEKELIDPNRNYSDEEIKEFILLPGFSTAEVVDNISGRGVGMDVVKTQILKIGGKVDIQSTLGVGSVFTLEVPVNHAIMNGTIIEMRNQVFIVPTMNVKEILQPGDDQWIFTQGKRTMLRIREDIVPIVPVSTFFKGEKLEEHVPLVILLEVDGVFKALPITNVINRQEVVVKPVGAEFTDLKYISGMSILGTGKVSLILDIDYLFKKEAKD